MTELAQPSQKTTNQLDEGGKRQQGKEGKSKPNKGKGEAYPPRPPAYTSKGKHAQLPTTQWCRRCRKKGHSTQACWWNFTNQQQLQQQHPQQQTWSNPSKQQQWTAQASKKRYQQRAYKTAQPVAYGLASDSQVMTTLPHQTPAPSLEHQTQASSFEHQPRATTHPAYPTPNYTIAQLDSSAQASSTTETWGILVDTGAATSVAPKSFASDIPLSSAPSTLQLTTATGKEVKTYGMKKVHLQSRGLRLEVSFVIADVVTPLLGLDILIKT